MDLDVNGSPSVSIRQLPSEKINPPSLFKERKIAGDKRRKENLLMQLFTDSQQ